MFRLIGIILTAVGVLSALAGSIWNRAVPSPDANIGAGLLVVLGLPLALIGLVLLVIAFGLSRRKGVGRRDRANIEP